WHWWLTVVPEIAGHQPPTCGCGTSATEQGLKVHKEVGNLIDWYNIQYYGLQDYDNCNSLLYKSSSNWPGTSLREIAQKGIPQQMLVIGKPATQADASKGYMAPDLLAICVQQAKGKGWSGGVMVWQYPNADAKWIKAVRAKSWPVKS
ncbi:uncharacterized protein FOMMEDRAFT_150504, partial [Fomitiporia mediterranea MF3/22]|uniref:uncharacterized protein n=1 Tax=Fomitiporia mediterranea (strain MF3/22) TaxID=694068 RepID=UPI0004409076